MQNGAREYIIKMSTGNHDGIYRFLRRQTVPESLSMVEQAEV